MSANWLRRNSNRDGELTMRGIVGLFDRLVDLLQQAAHVRCLTLGVELICIL